mgnify:CR=1 FL=1
MPVSADQEEEKEGREQLAPQGQGKMSVSKMRTAPEGASASCPLATGIALVTTGDLFTGYKFYKSRKRELKQHTVHGFRPYTQIQFEIQRDTND